MFLKIRFAEMIFCIIRAVLIIVSAERSLVSGWSTEIGCTILQSLHFYRPSHYAGRNAVLWKSVVGFSNIDCMLCEMRASLCSYLGASPILCTVYCQRFFLAQLARGVL